jgi:hypothetical protein
LWGSHRRIYQRDASFRQLNHLEQLQRQLKISDRERDRIGDRIWHDFLGADSNHQRRLEKFIRLWRMWRGLVETKGDPDVGPDFQVPYVKWFSAAHWARTMQALLGDDAEIVAIPTAPTDEKDAAKCGHYMTWRFFEYMAATSPLATWVFRTILFGRGHVECLYQQDYYWSRGSAKDAAKALGTTPANMAAAYKTAGLGLYEVSDDVFDFEQCCYDGPRLRALWPSQIILPAQDDCNTVEDFEWKLRRRRVTPQQLLDGERRGIYQGIKENWREIYAYSQQRQERDYWWDYERIDSDIAEGVDHATLMGNRDSVEVWEWYGPWRMLRGNRDVGEESIFYRNTRPSEILVRYLPKARLVVGVQDLRDIYPRMRKRTPFLDMALMRDGSYWGPGLGELLEDLQREGTINHALFRKAGMLSVGPVIFYKPSAGFDADTFKYDAGTAIPTEDPAAVNVVQMKADLRYSEMMATLLKSIGELLTGVSDQTNGQAIDRPNAPRTASGQAMLITEGNVRASLDMTMIHEDLQSALGYIWELDREYADEEVFFRVTEDDAEGLFETNKGFGTLTAEDREHNLSFELKFATSVYSREAKKAAILALYQLSVQNPLLQQNPRALWVLLNRVWEAFQERNFRDIIPEPPELDQPKQPKEEWALCLKHEPDEVHVNPLDNDDQHILDHRRRLTMATNEPADRRDKIAESIMVQHIIEHEIQKRDKMRLQIAVQAMVAKMREQQGGAAMPFPGQVPLNGAPPPPDQSGAPPGAGGPIPPAAAVAGPGGVGGPAS